MAGPPWHGQPLAVEYRSEQGRELHRPPPPGVTGPRRRVLGVEGKGKQAGQHVLLHYVRSRVMVLGRERENRCTLRPALLFYRKPVRHPRARTLGFVCARRGREAGPARTTLVGGGTPGRGQSNHRLVFGQHLWKW